MEVYLRIINESPNKEEDIGYHTLKSTKVRWL